MILVFATFNTKATAIKIGKALLKQRLIACYSMVPLESAWWWKGQIIDDKGPLVILKTKESNFPKIESYINEHSGYEVPEIVAVKADKVNPSYLKWLSEETK
ncbi:divalent-cation tolerance protein CutA [Candidatus Curtissbacteria bacterium]|nr:divalent-cation tolerance protein CutA [Candidatus Curtissbacteria bacterium]